MKVIIVGREASCDIEVNDAKVSRQHLQIVMNDGGQVSVIDLNSTNGTLVNGKRIQGECKVSQNDTIQVGDTVLPWQLILQKLTGAQAPTQKAARQGSASVNPQQQNNNNKKSKKPLIIIIVLAAIILIGGGVTYYLIRESRIEEQNRIEKENEAKQKLGSANEALMEEVDKQQADKVKAQQDKAKAEKEKADAEKAKADAEKDKVAAEKAKKEADKAKQKADDAKEKAVREKNKAKQAQADAEAKAKAAEQAKADAEAKADSLERVIIQNDINSMSETLESKIESLEKKDRKAVAESLGLTGITDKNAKEKIMEAFNNAKQKDDYDKMKQIYEAVKSGKNKAKQDDNATQIDSLNQRFKNARDVYKDNKKLALAIAQALNIKNATENNAASEITSAYNKAKELKDIATMTEMLNTIEQVMKEQQEQPAQQEGGNAEPQKEEGGDDGAKQGNMGDDKKAS